MIRKLKGYNFKRFGRKLFLNNGLRLQHLTEGDEENRENVGRISRGPNPDSNLALPEYSAGM